MAKQTSSGSEPAQKKRRRGVPNWMKQVGLAYQMTRRTDPAVTWWMVVAVVGVLGVAVVVGLLLDQLVYFLVLGLPFALLAAMFVLARRAEAAAYRQIEGQPGATISALRTIRRGWDFPEEPVAIDPRTQDMVFRGVGRPGVVLVAEAPPNRAKRLLENERKKVARVLPNVQIHLLESGNAEGQLPLRKLPRAVTRLKPTLTKAEANEVVKRLRALGGPRLPIPKGIDPTRVRPDRKGIRGR